jgi:hypothetical protein
VFRFLPAGGLGQLGDGVQDVLGADVLAHRAGGHRRVQQRRQDGAQPLPGVSGQAGEGRIGGV